MPRAKRTPTSIEITVTDDDICSAVPGDPGHCAIAQAFKREMPEAIHIQVGRGLIKYTIKHVDGTMRYAHRTSLTAAKAQDRLDKGLPVRADDFPVIRLHLDEAEVTPSTFTESVRQQQNQRRKDVRAGKRTVNPMPEEEKAKRREKRRFA